MIGTIDNTSEHMGGKHLPPELLKINGVDVLVCRGLGSRALDMCREFEIEVYVCQAEKVKDAFDLWKNSNIKKAGSDDVCKH